MTRKKSNNQNTTISIKWADKVIFRQFAMRLKQTKSGDRYESDADLFRRILDSFAIANTKLHEEPKSTYPSLNKSQPSSDSSESN
jgi:hypothetical protein